MKQITLLSAFLLMLQPACHAQETQSRKTENFEKIQVSGAVNVVYTDSDSLSLVVKAKASDADGIETTVDEGTLIIRHSKRTNGPVTIQISSDGLKGLEASGAADFKTTNAIQSDSFDLNVSGSANVKMKAELQQLRVLQSGASNVSLKGTAGEVTADIGGASTFKAYDLAAGNVSVTTSGAANAKVAATNTLRARATGASDIRIKGEPREFTAEAGSAANISRLKESSKSERNGSDTTAYNWKKNKLLIITDSEEEERSKKEDKEDFKHWRGFSMGVNGYLSAAGTMNLNNNHRFMDLDHAKSFNFQLNIMERHFNLVKNHVKLVTGFGFDFHQYAFANRTILDADTQYTWGSTDVSAVSYVKNKLRVTYLQVPLLLEFNTSNDPDKAFHIAAGVIGQFRISSRTKQVFREDGNEYKRVNKDTYNLNPFGLKAHLSLGYRSFTVFAEYGLTELFQPDRGPELYPVAAGVRLVPFS